jgi:hypothetical protein
MSRDRKRVLYTLTSRKTNSVTQPGRGIRKIVDLYHDLPVLVDKARAHTARKLLRPEELREVDRQESAGLTEDEIKERRKEYGHMLCERRAAVTHD